MPYELDCNKDGCYVVNTETGERKNNKRMPKFRASKYMRKLYQVENEKKDTKKEYETGAMVAFFIPEEQAKELALPFGTGETEPLEADDLHITLCYLGDTETDNLNRELVEGILERFVLSHSSLYGIVNGYGRFTNEESDKSPVYATFDSPNLPEFRQELVEYIENSGVEYKSDHGFTPHITLAYFPADEKVNLPKAPMVPIRFDSVVLSWGTERTEFELHGKENETMKEFFEQFLFTQKEKPTEKELSIDDKLMNIRNQITDKFNPRMRSGYVESSSDKYYWVQHLYEDYAILNEDGNYYRVDYSVDENGNVIIGDLQKVEQVWVLAQKEEKEPLATFEEEPEPDISHLMVFKEASGDYRWIMFSSNAFQDRDGEIVSQKALEADVERAKEDAQYGPLRWWHIGEPDIKAKTAGPGLDIGDCDFNEMHGKILIESGTFRDQVIGEAVAEKAADLQGSILFFHPQSEPDKEGVFHNIHRAERSLLPRGKASNSLVSLLVAKKELEMNILQEKWNKFTELIGETKVKEALDKAELTEKQAEALGFTSKGEGQEPEPDGGEAPPADGDPAGEGDGESFLGDMTPKQFQELQATAIKDILEPVGVQLKQIQDSQVTAKDTQTSLKEAMESQVKRLEEMDKRLKELEGETPRSQKGYRPSQDDDTVIDDTHSLKDAKPKIDPEFESFLFSEQQA